MTGITRTPPPYLRRRRRYEVREQDVATTTTARAGGENGRVVTSPRPVVRKKKKKPCGARVFAGRRRAGRLRDGALARPADRYTAGRKRVFKKLNSDHS